MDFEDKGQLLLVVDKTSNSLSINVSSYKSTTYKDTIY